MPRDHVTTPLALVGVFTILAILFCFGASYGATESKRMALVNQENIAWQK